VTDPVSLALPRPVAALPYVLALTPTAESSPAPENFFFKNAFRQKGYSLLGGRTIFGQVFVRGGMTKFSKWKVPPTGGSEPLGQIDFAERELMEYPRLPPSVRLDACEPHHLAPLLGFLGDQLAEVSGQTRKHRAAEVSEPRFHVGIGEASVDLLV
jgi:hypothetical protein